jgi:hypothetical protein
VHPRKEKARERELAGGEAGDAAANQRRTHNSTAAAGLQEPTGAVGRVSKRGDLFYIGGKHVAAVRNGWLRRNLRHERELLYGDAIAFRSELLDLARKHAGRGVCVRLPDGTVLTSAWQDWDAFAFDFSHRTYGGQRALPLARWHRPGERVAVQASRGRGVAL